MISRLKGTVVMVSPQHVTLDVHGVGYAVSVYDEQVYLLGQETDMHIYYHWNQDQGPQLFGFATLFSKAVFLQVISCSGCGPKIGLSVLAHMVPEEFVAAIATSDSKSLSRVSGIGPKKAELMITQLKDKVSLLSSYDVEIKHQAFAHIKQVSATLSALRYSTHEISSALDYLKGAGSFSTLSFDELLRKALAFLAKKV